MKDKVEGLIQTGQVRWIDSVTLGYLNHLTNDDILHIYRKRAGMPSYVDGMTGWGPSIGQYLGAYAKWYANTGDEKIREKAIDLFKGWCECVRARESLLCEGTYVW